MKTIKEAESEARSYIMTCAIKSGVSKSMLCLLGLGVSVPLNMFILNIASLFEIGELKKEQMEDISRKLMMLDQARAAFSTPWYLSPNMPVALLVGGAKGLAGTIAMGEVVVQYCKTISPLK